MLEPGLVWGFVLPFALWADASAGVEFRFASYISDHMVLQKAPAGAVLWGYGLPGAAVTVSLLRGQDTVMKKGTRVRVGSNTWMVVLDPVKPGGPFEVMAEQSTGSVNSTLSVREVLFGDVWLCSGQSNMEMTVSQIFNSTEELSSAAAYESVRIFSVAPVEAWEELQDLPRVDLQWSKPTSENLGHGNFTYMSAVCWLFGRYLYDTLGYPIGLIASSWGGTPIEAWSSARSLKACGVPQQGRVGGRTPALATGPREHSVLWNAMIHPLQNMTLKGVIWYQGEANMDLNRDLYNCTFPELIDDWRQTFHQGSQGQTQRFFPFGFVQLSSYLSEKTHHEEFPIIRWHQTADVGFVPNKRMPNTFMAVAMDLGDRNSPFGSIHPRDKQTVAHRLHLGARAVAYGEKVTFQGPMPEKIEVLAEEGRLNLTYSQQIQVAVRSDTIFTVSCCNDSQCQWLPVPVNTFSTRSLTLNISSCHGVPVAVRYAWASWPCDYKRCLLYHPASALPAPPFSACITPPLQTAQLCGRSQGCGMCHLLSHLL
ncbi:sialate O-acetylesterase [Sorex araneus]|uniref:sialate O-acetylesterase n=1 Tax=Sorex araneus TaxID=42254 RepID=UPI002433EB29|nr:sialate O-acetylesterase [Sorex araneus]